MSVQAGGLDAGAGAGLRSFLAWLESGEAAAVASDGGVTGERRPRWAPPAWLAQVIMALFGGQEPAAAAGWARRVHGELERLGGRVPFTVVNAWHAGTVVPMLAEVAARDSSDGADGADGGAHRQLRLLHERALAGDLAGRDEWAAALEPVLRLAYRQAYEYADAYATARAAALEYATANGFSGAGAVEFADGYAELNTGANATSFATANALANAPAMAAAFAAADAKAYAECYPGAFLHACALAWAGQTEHRRERAPESYARLANGLATSLRHAERRVGGRNMG